MAAQTPVQDRSQWDKILLPLVKCILAKKGVEQKSAAEIGRKKIDYFRGKDLVQFLLRNEQPLKKHCKAALEQYLDGDAPADAEDAEKLGQALMRKGFISKAKYVPLEGHDESAKRRKWPDRLQVAEGKFDSEEFYIIRWEGDTTWRNIMLFFLLILLTVIFLHKIWPNWAKIGAWYILLFFCILYICVELLRNGCFVLGWTIGFEFWILPNFNDDYCPFLDTFKPLWSCERRKDGWQMLLTRFAVFLVSILVIEEISKTHSVSDVQDLIVNSLLDINEWGENLFLQLEGPQERAALPNLADLEREEEEEKEKERLAARKKAPIEEEEPSIFDSESISEEM